VILPVLLLLAVQASDCSVEPGWVEHGKARVYEADSLFEYMDGNAEGYLIYGYTQLRGVTCRKDGETVLIDVHEMANPEAAWGIYAATHSPDIPDEPIGTVGQVGPRKAVFAKDKFLVEITAESDKDHSALLRRMALAMEKRVDGSAGLPPELKWFPPDAKSVRLVPESVLGIRALKRGFVAQYAAAQAFLITEATPEAATGVLAKLRARFGQTGDEGIVATDQYLGGIAVFRKGRYIAGAVSKNDKEAAVALAASFEKRLP
jgi:hypothetical protein